MTATQARVDILRSLGFTSISGTYAALGSPIGHGMRILHFINNTNADMLVSFDGTNPNLFLPAYFSILYDLQTNREENATFFVSLQTQVYVKENSAAPTSGSVYLQCIYGKGQ